jgi:tetratricopeptide (TPR) repeat protein
VRSTFTLAWMVLTRGRVTEARRLFTDAIAANRARGVGDGGISVEGMTASLEAWLLQQPETALRRLRTLLASDAWTGTPPANRPHLMIAQAFAAAGQPAEARALVAEFDALPSAQRVDDGWERSGAVGMIALAEGRPADAIELLRESSLAGGCEYCGLATVALAFREAGMPDSAIAYYRRYIDTPAMDRIGNDAWDLATAYESLAQLYEATGDITAARQYAALFVELWKDADPALQPRVRQKRDMLERLVEG